MKKAYVHKAPLPYSTLGGLVEDLVNILLVKKLTLNEARKYIYLPEESVDNVLFVVEKLKQNYEMKFQSIKIYSARIVTTSGPNTVSYALEFRHPLILTDDASQGRKIKRGAGTDPEEAQFLCNELNTLLSDPKYWDIVGYREAINKFSERAIQIFYTGARLLDVAPMRLI
ncbi:hypothetical protein D3C71_1236960 [compost metagenome]